MSETLFARQRARLRETGAFYALQALMLSFGGLLVVIGGALDPDGFLPARVTPQMWSAALIAAASTVFLGGWVLVRYRKLGRQLGLLGLFVYTVIAAPALVRSPSEALLVLLAVAVVGSRIRRFSAKSAEQVALEPELASHPRIYRGAVYFTSVVAIAAWALLAATGHSRGAPARIAGFAVFGVAILYTGAWVVRSLPRERRRGRLPFLGLVPPLAIAAAYFRSPDTALTWLAMHQLVALLLLQSFRTTSSTVWTSILEHPARLLASTFALICLVGGLFLSLPPCSARAEGIAAVDAFFTAVSATCVTGLIVLDTPNDFSFLGQIAIAVLIQIGGLGMMTFSTAGTLFLGRRLGLRHEAAVGGLLQEGADLYDAAKQILITTFVIEGIGAIALTALFAAHGDVGSTALWRGLFTAISAFCNAGFALQTDNMIPYQESGAVLHVVGGLVVLGGLGTPVIHALPGLVRRRRVALQAELALVATAVLLFAPALVMAVLEWSNPHTLGPLSVAAKLNNAWFLSVVPRTAGFNSVDVAALSPVTVTLNMILMFVGGSPFSTAGGVKTTTVALVVLGVIATVRGRPEASAFGRRISHESVYKAIAIMTMGSVFVLSGFAAIQLTQRMPYEMGLFEVVSALGTVGLSLGGTMRLDGVGKIIIMICMFAGRVGPVTLFLLLTEKKRQPRWGLPEEKVAVG